MPNAHAHPAAKATKWRVWNRPPGGLAVFAATLLVTLDAALLLAVFRTAIAESLWLDELHTSWCVHADSWREVAQRASLGNQTPLYFWLLWLLKQTLGHSSELLLRSVSVAASVLSLGLCLSIVRFETRAASASPVQHRQAPFGPPAWNLTALAAILAWFSLDRLQWFFATEARPYALVQLFTLAGWFCVRRLADRELGSRQRVQWTVGWSLSAVISVHLHLTAALPVAIQWLVGSAIVCVLSRSTSEPAKSEDGTIVPLQNASYAWRVWWIATICVVLAVSPIAMIAGPVWHRRSQWAAFAGDTTPRAALTMFLIGPILGCTLVALWFDRLVGWFRATNTEWHAMAWSRTVWWTAMIAPWLIAWVVTALEIAPMFHRRFVIASSLPLVIVGTLELIRVRSGALRWIALVVASCLILVTQGTWDIWRQGYLVGTLRGEDWRTATAWVRESMQEHGNQAGKELESEPLFCFSGLIEAAGVTADQLPLDESSAEYLCFPLRGDYAIHHDDQQQQIVPLVGDHRLWVRQVDTQLPSVGRAWIIYRGSVQRLNQRLIEFSSDVRTLGIKLTTGPPKSFGGVHVVELQAAN